MITRHMRGASIGFALAAALAAGCDSTSNTAIGPSPVKCQVSLAASTTALGADGGTGTVDVSTNAECTWTAAATAAWIASVSPANGQGNGQIQFRATANPQPTARNAEIDVNGSRVTLRQEATACRYDLTPATQTLGENGGSGTVAVSTIVGCSWTATTDSGWITLASGRSGDRSGSIGFTVTANTGGERTGTVNVGDTSVTVVQRGALACVYTLEPADQTVDAAGGQANPFSVATSASCAWTATSQAPWITVTSGGSGTGAGAVGIAVEPNVGGTRTGTIAVANVSYTVTQTQSASGCGFALSPTARSVNAAGGAGAPIAVSAQTGCAWNAVSNVPWITIASGPGGNGNGAVTYVVAPNPGGARIGTLTIAGQTFTMTQDADAAACGFAIAPASRSIGASGGAGLSFAVTAAAGCSWTAVSNAPWITLASGGGSGSGAVSYSVASNGGGARTGTITLANQTFSVQQDAAAAACSYSIAPGRDTLDAAGGAGAVVGVNTASGCAWTAASNEPWLSITSGANGNGAGSVRFSAAANAAGERSGTLTIAGNQFIVTQRAAATSTPCTFAVAPASASFTQLGGAATSGVSTAAGCAWTAVSNDPWIAITAGSSGNGSGAVSFSAGANLGAARSGTLTVAGQTVTVTQAALVTLPACSYAIAPGQQSIGVNGGAGNSVGVTAPQGCPWSASSNAGWLTITSGASGAGSGSVGYSVDSNSGGARSGTLTVAGQTFTVNQAGAAQSCSFSVSPSNQSIGSLGGAGSFTVTTAAGCSWSASSQASWISITSGSSGSGSGTVSFSAGIYLLGQRTGTITIAGQTVTVTQSGVLN